MGPLPVQAGHAMLSDSAHQGAASMLHLHGKPRRIGDATSGKYRIKLFVNKSASKDGTVGGPAGAPVS